MTSTISCSILSGPDSVSALSISNNLLASGFEDGSVSLWSPNMNSSFLHFPNSSDPCTALSFNDSCSILYSAHGTHIILWDIRMVNNPMSTWKVSDDEINCIDLLEAEMCLSAADDTGAVKIISTDTGLVSNTLNNHENICSVVKFRQNYTDEIVSAGLDCCLIVSHWKCSRKSFTIFKMDEIINNSAYTDILSSDCDESPSEAHDSDSSVYDVSTELAENNSLKDLPSETLGSDPGPPSPVDGIGDDSNSLNNGIDGGDKAYPTTNCHQAPVRVASSFTSSECSQFALAKQAGSGLPLNPPMVHSIACTSTGDYFYVGLESGTVEVFNGKEKYLKHMESLCGHSRGVAALLLLQDTFLLSGGNDSNLFLWELASGGTGQQIVHSGKINALAGERMSQVFVADSSSVVQMVDLSRL